MPFGCLPTLVVSIVISFETSGVDCFKSSDEILVPSLVFEEKKLV